MNFDDTQAGMLSEYDVDWEPNGAYLNPQLEPDGTPVVTHAVPVMHDITGNATIGTPPTVAGSSNRLTLKKYAHFVDDGEFVRTGISAEPAFPYTIAMWLRPSDVTGSRALLGRGEASGFVMLNGRPCWFRDGTHFHYLTNSAITADEWIHLVYVVNGLDVSADQGYVDGVASGSTAQTTGPIINAGDWTVGWAKDTGIAGDVADVRIYKKALAQAEVDWLYAMGTAGTYPGGGSANLHFYYDFHKGYGTAVEDMSGSGNDGLLENTSETVIWVPTNG